MLGPEAVKGQTPDGAVEMQEVQVAYIGSAGAGMFGVDLSSFISVPEAHVLERRVGATHETRRVPKGRPGP